MKSTKIIAAVLLMTVSTVGFGQGWTADKAHSRLSFEVIHLMVTDVNGDLKILTLLSIQLRMILQMLKSRSLQMLAVLARTMISGTMI